MIDNSADRNAARSTARSTVGRSANVRSANERSANERSAVAAPRLRLTRRGRVVFTSMAAAPLVLAAAFFALNGGMATATVSPGSPTAQSSNVVTVTGGQSLWGLAEGIAPNEDPREVIAQLVHTNALASAEIHPGQRLVVPEQYR